MCKRDFYKKAPCDNCPYRKDAPLKLWDKYEFEKLLEQDDQWGGVYGCHKNDGHTCVGWLILQDQDRHPNILLRLQMMKHGVTREYLDALHSKVELYGSVEEMIQANYPELLKDR